MVQKNADDITLENEGCSGIHLLEMGSFLDRLDGKKELAAKLIELFLKHSMEKQAGIKKAIYDNNAERLKDSAHSFKGMLLHFCKKAATLAHQLENMGNSGEIDKEKANLDYDNMIIIIDQIKPELKKYHSRFKGPE